MSYPHPKRWKLKHNAFLNSASHSPWVVRQVALETKTQRFPMGRVGN
ncbi:hypothetical protein LEP1GSC021_1526 [Leptospira noguchii str. 1993005606]|nr:hypothetical protein [Leptospira noguchii]EPE83146.1 hypothetical protein LEP1GSC021_1526 [Leptospira noguchii str. 1993005606]